MSSVKRRAKRSRKIVVKFVRAERNILFLHRNTNSPIQALMAQQAQTARQAGSVLTWDGTFKSIRSVTGRISYDAETQDGRVLLVTEVDLSESSNPNRLLPDLHYFSAQITVRLSVDAKAPRTNAEAISAIALGEIVEGKLPWL